MQESNLYNPIGNSEMTVQKLRVGNDLGVFADFVLNICHFMQILNQHHCHNQSWTFVLERNIYRNKCKKQIV